MFRSTKIFPIARRVFHPKILFNKYTKIPFDIELSKGRFENELPDKNIYKLRIKYDDTKYSQLKEIESALNDNGYEFQFIHRFQNYRPKYDDAIKCIFGISCGGMVLFSAHAFASS